MSLIELFTDHIVNKKSLVEYVKKRETINERGEFNDDSLIKAQENLDRLKDEDNVTYNEMYNTLEKIMKTDNGHAVEYPINFIKEILKMYKTNISAKEICSEYKKVLDHDFRDA